MITDNISVDSIVKALNAKKAENISTKVNVLIPFQTEHTNQISSMELYLPATPHVSAAHPLAIPLTINALNVTTHMNLTQTFFQTVIQNVI